MRINRIHTGKSLKFNYMSSNCLINHSRAYVWFSVPYRSFVICAGKKQTKTKQMFDMLMSYFMFSINCKRPEEDVRTYVSVRWLHITLSCKHAFTPTQTAIHCSRAGCHVHLLTLVRITAPQSARDTSIFDSFTFSYR